MSLRKKDDWDEALEEAGSPRVAPFVPGPGYNYGAAVKLSRPKKPKGPEYPIWICLPCGNKLGHGYPEGHTCTIHTGVCGICGETRGVTEPRDFGHLKPGWEAHCVKNNRKVVDTSK